MTHLRRTKPRNRSGETTVTIRGDSNEISLILNAAIRAARDEMIERRRGPSLLYWHSLRRRLETWEAMAAALDDEDDAACPINRDF